MTTIKSATQVDVDRIRAAANDSWLVAAQMNVYYEAMRRRGKRVVFSASDVNRLFTMIAVLLEVGEFTREPTEARPHSPTEEEQDQILNPPERELEPESEGRRPNDSPLRPLPEEIKSHLRRRMGQ